MTRDREKLKTLIHYVCWKVEPAILGSIKLNKVLWLSDLSMYVSFGEAMTGEHYVKRQFGPVSLSGPGLIGELEHEKRLVVRRRDAFGYDKVDYIALTKPDISAFKPDEISLVDSAIQYVCYEHTAREISAKTHDVIWELADLGEEIPYEAMLASRLGEVTPEDLAWAKTLVAA